MEPLETTSDVIDALGGTSAVARLFGVDLRVVSNWRGQKHFPARTFVVFRDALVRSGLTAPDSLWAMAGSPPRPLEGAA